MKTTKEQRRKMKVEIDRIFDSLILANKMLSNQKFEIAKYSHRNERHNWEFKNISPRWTTKINIETVLCEDAFYMYYFENYDSALRNIDALQVEELFGYNIDVNRFRGRVTIDIEKVEDIVEVITILFEKSNILY